MSRSISQIYAEAVATRNNYLQISSLDSGRSESKLSVINILTYVMAALIYSYEVLFDVFQVQIAQLIAERASGTPSYYVKMAKYFQFNPSTLALDEMEYDESTFQPKFKTLDETHQIIAKAAYEPYTDTGIILKVCKDNSDVSDADGGGIYTCLSSNELTAFKNYMDEIKFVGAKIYCRSVLGDILGINATIIYDDLYIDEKQALNNVKAALINYIKTLDFNGYVYYQSIIDAIQGAEHIVSVSGANGNDYAKVTLSEYDDVTQTYKEAESVVERRTPSSGYLTFVDESQSGRPTTLKADDAHFIFKANSLI